MKRVLHDDNDRIRHARSSSLKMKKDRRGSAPSNEDSNGHVHQDQDTSSHAKVSLSALNTYKPCLLAFIAVVGTAIVLKDFGVLKNINETISGSSDAVKVGGWRLPNAETLRLYHTDLCHVDRLFADEISSERFEEEYRFKKPLIFKFRNGARDWTDPEKWTVKSMKAKYGKWKVYSGNSLSIVRKGGNGYIGSTFSEYVTDMFNDFGGEGEPAYAFDRTFYDDSDLPDTIKPPPYLAIDPKEDDSLFFLGSSRTGVSFHNHADAWNAVIYGYKRWFLYPIERTPPGGVYPGFTQLDWFHIVYPNLTAGDKPIECIQGPGEIFYLPEGYYHGTINLGDTIAIGIQKKRGQTAAIQHIYKENDLRSEGDKSMVARIELINKILDMYPDSAEMKMRLGGMYLDMEQLEEAESFSQAAIDQDPFFLMAMLNLADTKAKLKKDEEAEYILHKALSLNPNVWDCYAKYGMFLFQRERWQEAVDVFRKGTEVDPNQKPFYFFMRQAQEELGDVEGVRKTTRQMQRLSEAEHTADYSSEQRTNQGQNRDD